MDDEKQSEVTEGGIADRINQFLYDFDKIDDAQADEYLSRIADETALAKEDVQKVIESLLTIAEEKKDEKGFSSSDGQAMPAYILKKSLWNYQWYGWRR